MFKLILWVSMAGAIIIGFDPFNPQLADDTGDGTVRVRICNNGGC